MPYRNTQLVVGEFYHIVKRGVDQRDIYLDNEDRFRFINSLLVFNDKKPAPWSTRAFWHQRDPTSLGSYIPKEPLVEIHTFVLMKNHFHLLVRQLVENGIVDFMKKLGGYSYYFNKKYERVGPLFQGRFKSILIKSEEQLKNVFVYIHTNPLEIIKFNWKEKGIDNPKRAIQFLENYKWSSYPDYLGKENFPNVTKRDFFFKLLGGREDYKREVESWIQYKVEISKTKNVLLE